MLIIFILLLLSFPVQSEERSEVLFGIGSGIDIPGPAAPTPSHSIVLSYRYFIDNTFMFGKLIGYEKNNWIGAGLGYRWFFSSRWAVEGTLGLGYLDNPEEDPRLTGHRQFNVNFGLIYRIADDVLYSITWEHLSNCKTICYNDDEKYEPNDARDYLTNAIIWRF